MASIGIGIGIEDLILQVLVLVLVLNFGNCQVLVLVLVLTLGSSEVLVLVSEKWYCPSLVGILCWQRENGLVVAVCLATISPFMMATLCAYYLCQLENTLYI